MRWRYSISYLVFPFNNELAYLHRNLRGYFLYTDPRAEIFVPLVSNVDSTIYCVRVLAPPPGLVFHDGLCSSSLFILFLTCLTLFGLILFFLMIPALVISSPYEVRQGSPSPSVGCQFIFTALLVS